MDGTSCDTILNSTHLLRINYISLLTPTSFFSFSFILKCELQPQFPRQGEYIGPNFAKYKGVIYQQFISIRT